VFVGWKRGKEKEREGEERERDNGAATRMSMVCDNRLHIEFIKTFHALQLRPVVTKISGHNVRKSVYFVQVLYPETLTATIDDRRQHGKRERGRKRDREREGGREAVSAVAGNEYMARSVR
jgi:hypothetical protein